MKILLISSTHLEIASLLSQLNIPSNPASQFDAVYKDLSLYFCVCGVGIAQFGIQLGGINVAAYELVLNIGIAGSFSPRFPIGSIVNVVEDQFADFGVSTPNGFIPMEELLEDCKNSFKNNSTSSYAAINQLEKAVGITVNTIHGEQLGIDKVKLRLNPDVETMEGAVFFLRLLKVPIPYFQLRSISNVVEPRNKDNWNIPLATTVLGRKVIHLLDEISTSAS